MSQVNLDFGPLGAVYRFYRSIEPVFVRLNIGFNESFKQSVEVQF